MKKAAIVSIFKILFVILVLSAFSCSEDAEDMAGPASKDVTEPVAAEFDPMFAQKLQFALDDARETTDVIGLSAAVIMPDGETWVGVSGVSHPGVPITPDMLFDMASAGKNLLAALMLKLAEEGLLSLDDPISKYLPSYPNVDDSITIRQCLNHTGGLYDF